MFYTIEAGEHTCKPRFPWPILFKKEIHYEVEFDQSAKYKTKIPVNQHDINKLIGFSEGFNHQKNSARIGFRWKEELGLIELVTYVYNRGERLPEQTLGYCAIGENVVIKIRLFNHYEGPKYQFLFYGFHAEHGINIVNVPRAKKGKFIFGFRLNPYFGGDETAPHEMKIWLDKL